MYFCCFFALCFPCLFLCSCKPFLTSENGQFFTRFHPLNVFRDIFCYTWICMPVSNDFSSFFFIALLFFDAMLPLSSACPLHPTFSGCPQPENIVLTLQVKICTMYFCSICPSLVSLCSNCKATVR